MKNHVLFSSKHKGEKLKCRLLQYLFGALRDKAPGKKQQPTKPTSAVLSSNFMITIQERERERERCRFRRDGLCGPTLFANSSVFIFGSVRDHIFVSFVL